MENISYLTFTGLCNYKYTNDSFNYKIGKEFLLYLKTEKTFHSNDLKWKIIGNCDSFKRFIKEYHNKKDHESVVIIYICSLFCKYVGSNFTLGPISDFGTMVELYMTGQADLQQVDDFLNEIWTYLIDIIFLNTEIVVAYKYQNERHLDFAHDSSGFDKIDDEEGVIRTNENLNIDDAISTSTFIQEQFKLKIMFVDSIDSTSQLSNSNILVARKIIVYGDGHQIDSINIVNNIHKSSKEVILVAKGEYEDTMNLYLLSFNHVKRQPNTSDINEVIFIVKQNELLKYLENRFHTKDFEFDQRSNGIIFDSDNKTFHKLEFHFYFNTPNTN